MLYNNYNSEMSDKNYRVCDIMVCAMARLIKNGDTVFHGVSSHMPMTAVMLAKALHAPDAVYLNIPGGVNPKPSALQKYTSAGNELLERSTAYFPLAEVFDLSMRGKLDVAFLSGIQFDVNGNVNASVIGDYHKPKVRMPGGAGSAVLIPTAKRAIIWRTKHEHHFHLTLEIKKRCRFVKEYDRSFLSQGFGCHYLLSFSIA